jgi:hypothetical protein
VSVTAVFNRSTGTPSAFNRTSSNSSYFREKSFTNLSRASLFFRSHGLPSKAAKDMVEIISPSSATSSSKSVSAVQKIALQLMHKRSRRA